MIVFTFRRFGIGRVITLFLVFNACLSFGSPAATAEAPIAEKTGDKIPVTAPDYDSFSTNGFTVYVEKRLDFLSRIQYDALKQSVASHLKDALDAFPPKKRSVIQQTSIWIDWNNTGNTALTYDNWWAGVMFYHPMKGEIPGIDQFKRGGVVLSGAYCFDKNWEEYLREYYENWMVHELAHSYHDRALGFEKENVKSAFKAAQERGLYQLLDTKVPSDQPGKPAIQRLQSYAGKNHIEYFAEISVAYLARRSSYPYNRADLKKYDAVGYALMVDVWGEKKD